MQPVKIVKKAASPLSHNREAALKN